MQGRRGVPRRHDVVAPRRFGVSKDIEPPNVSRVTTGRQRAATGGKKRQKAAKSGKGRQRGLRVTAVRRKRASCVTPARHRRDGCSSKRGAHYQFRKVPRRKSAASPGASCVPQKCAIKGAFVCRTVWQQRTVPRGAAETQLAFLTFVQNSYPISP